MSGQHSPHDAVFRRVLGDPENAASQLRAVLPAGVAGRLDLDQLARVSGSFVDDALRWRHSDLLFTAPVDGREAFLYILVEHQSSTDPLMPFRMLRYVGRIWERYIGPPAIRASPTTCEIGPTTCVRSWAVRAASTTSWRC